MFTLRPFDMQGDADYALAHQIEQEYYPDRKENIAEQRFFDQSRSQNALYVRQVIEVDGEAVGIGGYRRADTVENNFGIHILIRRAFTRRGLASGFLQHAYDAIAAHAPAATITQTREDQTEARAFLAKHGYKQTLRTCRSALDVVGFDSAEFSPIINRIEQAGYTLSTLAELQQSDPDWLRKVYDVNVATLIDVPQADTVDVWPFETWAERVVRRPSFAPEMWVIAVAPNGDYAGLTMLRPVASAPKEMKVGLTGVRREHRRRGLCTAMKARVIAAAQAKGIERMETLNEENNPMLQINLRLGFELLPAQLDFERAWQ